jgi:hypothetical protein
MIHAGHNMAKNQLIEQHLKHSIIQFQSLKKDDVIQSINQWGHVYTLWQKMMTSLKLKLELQTILKRSISRMGQQDVCL